MKRLLTMWATIVLAQMAFAQKPAFPGAEGHGRYATGGRGGKIVHVTNLNDSGTGSFRAAVKGDEKKIVVFDVGGVIALNSDVNIGGNTTIMGQTAPKPGITLRYYTVSPAGNNIIMRFIRIRRGQERDINDGADASWCRNLTNIMLDHCSFSWSIDETASFYDNNNFTMQWCTIGESLVNAGHGKGAHGYGGIWGGKLASFHHNFLVHHSNRTPRFNGARYDWNGYTSNTQYSQYGWENAVQAENVDFRNCVVYNCGNGCYGGPGGGKINMVNNYYKTGPAGGTSKLTTVTVGAEGNAKGYPIYWGMTSRYFVEGNTIDDNPAGWANIDYDDGTITRNGVHYSKDINHYNGEDVSYLTSGSADYVCIKLDEPAPTGEVTTHSAETAFEKVVWNSGASLYRDEVDERYANEAIGGTADYIGSVTGKAGRIDVVADVEGYTEKNFGTGSRSTGFDSDNDGMPDDWEIENDLDPNSAADANLFTLDPVRYYTNIEVYCNSLVQHIMLTENEDAEQKVEEYYPAYTTERGKHVAAINMPEIPAVSNVEYTLSQSTNMGGNNTSTYYFDEGLTITNGKSKGYATGNNDGIKYSAGVQYTIHLPADVAIDKAVFTGYDNYTDADAYLGEVNGTSYDATTYVFPKTKATVINTVEFATPATNTITFTPQGKQMVLIIKLEGTKGTTGINETTAGKNDIVATEFYNLHGIRVAQPQAGALTIRIDRHADGTSTKRKIAKRN